MRKPNITLVSGYIPFVFVIPPTDFTVEMSQRHESIDIIDKGEKVEDGKRRCKRVSFSGFFPSISSPLHSFLNPLPPEGAREFLEYHKNKNTKFKLIVPEWAEFLKCKIEDFNTTRRDHTGDLYFSITLVEEREGISTILNAATGLFERVVK